MNKTEKSTTNRKLDIVILDEDKFYASGLEIMLAIYLKNIGQSAVFSSHYSCKKKADIIFQAIRCGTVIASLSSTCANNNKPQYIVIVDRKDTHLTHLYRNINNSNILYRHQSVNLVLQLMENVLRPMQWTSVKTHPNSETLLHASLTRREQEVLHQLQQGKSHADVANILGINEKTISSHKRTAMKKLNFKRTAELVHWINQGGLTHHQLRKGN
ncbi:LuxR C-terminal-related transcriptional regulator [Serratia marcescens]